MSALLDRLEELGHMQGAVRARSGELQAWTLGFLPWWGQRLVRRSDANCRVLVAARQVGKSYLAVFLTLEVALGQPGSYSVLLTPTYLHARPAIHVMRRVCSLIPGCEWREQLKRVVFPNGSIWQVFSADRPNAVRGPKLDGILWVDEAAFLRHASWTAALGALSAAKNPRKLLTTSPMGKNWVFDEFVSQDPHNEPFRFRSGDSPFVNHEEVARNRAKMTPERAAQEFDAEFVDALILAFPNLRGLFVREFPKRERQARRGLGIDLGKDQDWTVVVLINEFGEAEVVGRWRHVSWPETEERILSLIELHAVSITCVDKAYVGGYLVDRLRALGKQVLDVATNARQLKARLVETLRADVQHSRIRVRDNEHADQLRYELRRFQGTRRAVHGRIEIRYECPEVRGEHDDCVIALCLANWVRHHGLVGPQPVRADIRRYVESARRIFGTGEDSWPKTPAAW
ncbi:MAG TPA: hypothetical protein DEA08_37400 [Planctomycetes bacterium]|nr:hypothetical protein [Planctomycetota bacterium]